VSIFGAALRAVKYHWRTHLASIAFVALATAIVTGALEVQTSIRSHLTSELVTPLGRIKDAIVTNGKFSADLAHPGETAALVLNSTASANDPNSTVQITVWGVGPDADEMWPGFASAKPGKALVSPALARNLGLSSGSILYLRVPSPNSAPLSSVFGRRLVRESTVEVAAQVELVLPNGGISGLSLVPTIGEKNLAIVDRNWLSAQLKIPGAANVLLTPISAPPTELAARFTLRDYGISISEREGELTVRSDRVILSYGQVRASQVAAARCGSVTRTSLVALAEQIRCGNKRIYYAMAVSDARKRADGTIRLNSWAADDLNASPGDAIEITLLAPKPDGSFAHEIFTGSVSSILPMTGAGANPQVVPKIAGMTDSGKVSDWSTPFPVDLTKISDRDEAYWKRYRAAPKLFVDGSVTRSAWGGQGAVTAVTITGGHLDRFGSELLRYLRPEDSDISIVHVRERAIHASMGSSDLAGLVMGLSSFLILASLGLAGSLLLLNFQSRRRELDLMRRIGLSSHVIGALMFAEAMIVACLGAVLGSPAGAVLAGLSLTMFSHWMPASAGFGAVPIHVTLDDLAKGLLSGLACALVATLAYTRSMFSNPRVQSARKSSKPRRTITTHSGLLFRSIRYRPLRFLSVAGVVAAGTAVLGISAGSMKSADSSGEEGIALQVETALPVAIDWMTPDGRKRLHFDPADEAVFKSVSGYSLLRSPGVDVSCLNPAKPMVPRLAGINEKDLIHPPFPAIAANSQGAWNSLRLLSPNGKTLPAIGDSDTTEWILGSGLGQTYDLQLPGGEVVKLWFVGATHGTFLAGDILVSRTALQTAYPDIEAPTLFLVKTPPQNVAAVRAAINRNLADYGVTIKETASILRALHGVMNAYLSIFLVFGSLGLALGVCGASLAAARNAADRRQEFALMMAVGIPRSRISSWIVAETYLAIVLGVVCGVAGGVAITVLERSNVMWPALTASTLSIVIAATAACFAVSSLFLRRGVVEALRSE
jgi:hypothetical protein